MTAADEIAHLKALKGGWGEGGAELAPTWEALLKAEALLTDLDAAGHVFSGFPVEDGGVDLQSTTETGCILVEIAPNGHLRDLTLANDVGVTHAPADDEAITVAQINMWRKP